VSTEAAQRVYLHIGAPKSGTTFLQRAMWRHREELLDEGILLPGDTAREMFHGAIAVRETHETWGLQKEDVQATWGRLCAEAQDFPGTTIMSHELLAAATQEEAEAALTSLKGLDVHIVITARDLARQVMSEWQERIKNGSKITFTRFESNVAKQLRTGELTGLFWRYHHVLDAFLRWGSGLPPENLHLVVAPQSGADPRELWRRFGDAVGFDAEGLDPIDPRGVSNASLGVTQVAVLRRINEALDGRIPQPAYGRVVKREFAQRLLINHPSPRLVCPPGLRDQLTELAEQWVDEIEARGYSVHGDLEELLPRPADADAPTPDDVDPAEEAQLAAAAAADLLVERNKRRRRAAAAPAQPVPLRRRIAARLARIRDRVRRRT
jgi:hypothetical protein